MYKLLKDSLKIRRYLLVTILVIQFISVILSTLLPYMNGMFVDMLIDIKNVEEVIKYAITIAGVGIISLFLSYIYNLKIMKVKNNISFEINSRGILHLQKIPLEIEYEPTYMTQRLNSDSRIVVDFFFDKIITAKLRDILNPAKRDISDNKIIETLKKFTVDYSIFENDLNYEILEKGGNMSGGEAQKLSLVRMVLENKPWVLLDEPTSAMDVECEKIICSILKEYLKRRTAVIITHRPEILSICDKIIRLES